MNNAPIVFSPRAARQLVIASVILFLLGCGVLTWAIVMPIDSAGIVTRARGPVRLEPMPSPSADVKALQAKMATHKLIQPGQVRAAVKDNGAAARLLARLKLQGIVNLQGHQVAYVNIEKEGLHTVQADDKILDFHVDEVGSDKVTLSLDGVVVELHN